LHVTSSAALLVMAMAMGAARAPVANVVVYGAKPNDDVSDVAAFNAAIAAATSSGTPGVVYVPVGTFDIDKTTGPAGVLLSGITTGVTIRCESRRSVLKMKYPGNGISVGDFYMFRVLNSNNVRIENCTLDGNKAAVTEHDEQTHHVVVAGTSRYFSAHNVHFKDSPGDGIKAMQDSDRLDVTDCLFTDNDRGGITVQTELSDFRFARNRFYGTSDQAIDFEPTSGGAHQGSIIDNIIGPSNNNAICITVTGIVTTTNRIIVANNRIMGPADSVRAENIIWIGNEFENPTQGLPCLNIHRRQRGTVITGNTMRCVDYGIYSAATTAEGASPGDLVITSNVIELSGANGSGIRVEGGPGGIIIANNRVKSTATNTAPSAAINLRDTLNDSEEMTGNAITGNVTSGFRYGVRLSGSPGVVSRSTVTANVHLTSEGSSFGVLCDGNTANITVTGNTTTAATAVSGCSP
jgi:hypothetical protein